MANVEQYQEEKSGKEKWGRRFVLGGIVAGIIGLLARWESLFEAGIGLAASGEIFRRFSKKPSQA